MDLMHIPPKAVVSGSASLHLVYSSNVVAHKGSIWTRVQWSFGCHANKPNTHRLHIQNGPDRERQTPCFVVNGYVTTVGIGGWSQPTLTCSRLRVVIGLILPAILAPGAQQARARARVNIRGAVEPNWEKKRYHEVKIIFFSIQRTTGHSTSVGYPKLFQ